MANEKIEIEVLINGKPAIAAINKVDKKTEKLGKTTKKTGKDTDGVLTKMRAGWIAVGASVAIAVTKAASFERMSLGLTKAQKDWAKQTALATDIQADQVAGFLKSAKTAGLAEDAQKQLAEQAIALGYAFPHEDAETLHDNLVMLTKTGEAQGFMVDILEQQYVGLGEEISTLDLKTKSWAEKMALVGDVAEISQRQMDASKFQDYNRVISTMDNTLTDLGTTLVTLGSDGKGFSFAARSAETFKNVILFIAAGIKTMVSDIGSLGEYFGFFEEKIAKTEDLTKKSEELLSVEERLRKLYIFKAQIFDTLSILEGSQLKAAQRQIEMTDKQIDSLIKHGEVIKRNSRDVTDEIKKNNRELTDTGKDTAQALGGYFADMAVGIKTSFSDMAKSILQKLLAVKFQAMAANALTGMGGLDIFDTFSKPKLTIPSSHTGGAIGSTKIPSFHTGFRSDERLAKLQVGEAVVNRAGATRNAQAIDAMNAGFSVGNGGNTQVANITFQVQAFDSASFQQGMVKNRATIVGVVREAFNRNGKSVAL